MTQVYFNTIVDTTDSIEYISTVLVKDGLLACVQMQRFLQCLL